MKRPECWFIDVDGCILRHHGTLLECLRAAPEALPGSIEFLVQLQSAGHRVILTTGRPYSTKNRTEQQLQQAGAIYHQLVMDCGGGRRYLVNDLKPDEDKFGPTAVAKNMPRNRGFIHMERSDG